MSRPGATSHGESQLRVLRIVRRGDRHDPRDLMLSIRVDGDFGVAFLEGGPGVIPGAAVRKLAFDVARDHGDAEIEPIGLALCRQLLERHRQVARVRVDVAEQPWVRMHAAGKAQGQAFVRGGPEQRTVAVTSNGVQVAVVSGIEGLSLMRTAGFLERPGEPRAEDGTEDAVPALLVGALSARWTYSNPDVTFGPYRHGVRSAILDTFALHAARSVQYTLFAIAEAVLGAYEEIRDVTLAMQERTYRPPDPFHVLAADADELLVSADEPVGLVEVTVERDAPPRP